MTLRSLAAAVLLLLLFGQAALVHHGLGPAPTAATPDAWSPTGFLYGILVDSPLAPLLESRALGLPILLAPALFLAFGVFLTTRSALLRTLAVYGVLVTGTFLYYALGDTASQVWQFFGFRWSGVMLLTPLAVAVAAMAPWLARSWLARAWPLRALLYLPVCILAVALIRNATGTDPTLPFAISPWPVIPVFGLSIGAALIAILFAVLAGLVAVFSTPERRTAVVLVALLGFALLACWRLFALPLPEVLQWSCALSVLVLSLAGGIDPLRPGWAQSLALAAVLTAAPVALGQAWAKSDYEFTRDVAAQEILDALAGYYEQEDDYPDDLEALVDLQLLERVPRPRIGFGARDEAGFVYQNFGTSYILEFSAPGWVQCAYNPPWDDEFEDDAFYEDDESEGAEAFLPGSWSCPAKLPDLF